MQDLLPTILSNFLNNKNVNTIWIAYSGGVDSHVLLHLAIQSRSLDLIGKLKVVHVNHHLSIYADSWQKHVEEICAELNVELKILHLQLSKRGNLEARARDARYQAIRKLMNKTDCLLTAHHAEDQAETVMLQLMRGSGPLGLSGMPFWQNEPFLLGRPLLNCSKGEILNYASIHKFNWIEDESNLCNDFKRNFLRNKIFPLIRKQYPEFTNSLLNSAWACRENEESLKQLLQPIYNSLCDEDNRLELEKFQELSNKLQRQILRLWLKKLTSIIPSAKKIIELQRQLITASEDKIIGFAINNVLVKKYDNKIYALKKNDCANKEIPCELLWDLNKALDLPCGKKIIAYEVQGLGLAKTKIQNKILTIRFREGGERCKIAGRNGTHSLKKLFQEKKIPPWKRAEIPLIYINYQLAAVGDLFICSPWQAENNETGYVIEYEKE